MSAKHSQAPSQILPFPQAHGAGVPSDPDSPAEPTALLSGTESRRARLVGLPYRERTVFSSGDVVQGRFRILRFLASGGSGEVYEALDTELRCPVALKVIKPKLADQESAIERFRREIALARQVTHPNVSRIFDVFRHELIDDEGNVVPTLFLTMELLTGETLANRLRTQGPMDPEEALPIIVDLVEGLKAAHRAGVIHRDFKSANIMLSRDDDEHRPVITDFGLAVDNEHFQTEDLTHTGTVVGTPFYMAPEQLTGQEITPATDQYALGVVIYEMVTGKRPFVGSNEISTAIKRLSQAPTSPREHMASLPANWEQSILRCLEVEPGNRFANLDDLIEGLVSTPRAPAEKSIRRAPSRAFLVGAAAALLLALLLVNLAMTGLNLTVQRPTTYAEVLSERLHQPRLTLLPLEDRSDEPAPWVSSTIMASLSSMLRGTDELTVSESSLGAAELAASLIDRSATDSATSTADAQGTNATARLRKLNTAEIGQLRRSVGADLLLLGWFRRDASAKRVLVELVLYDDAEPVELSYLSSEDQLAETIERAVVELRSVVGLEPRAIALSAEQLEQLAERARLRLDFDSARFFIEEALSREDAHPTRNARAARIYWQLDDVARAQGLIDVARRDLATLDRREQLEVEGIAALITQESDEAADVFSALHRFFPDETSYWMPHLETLALTGRDQLAIDRLGDLRTRTTEDLGPQFDLLEAQLLGRLSDPVRQEQRARQLLERTSTRESGRLRGEALLQLAEALSSQGEDTEARTRAQAALELLTLEGATHSVERARQLTAR